MIERKVFFEDSALELYKAVDKYIEEKGLTPNNIISQRYYDIDFDLLFKAELIYWTDNNPVNS